MTTNLETHDTSGVVRGYWQESDYPTSAQIIERVAAAAGTSPEELPPLQETVDADAIDTLFPPGGDVNCCLAFRFADTEVFISADGSFQAITTG